MADTVEVLVTFFPGVEREGKEVGLKRKGCFCVFMLREVLAGLLILFHWLGSVRERAGGVWIRDGVHGPREGTRTGGFGF